MSKRKMALARKDNSTENILASFFEERDIDLTPYEIDRKAKIEFTFKRIVDADSLFDPVDMIMRKYEMSLSSAYRLINETELIFGGVRKFNKEAWKFIQIERKRKIIGLALKDKNLELAAKLERDIDKILDFGKEEGVFDPDKIKTQNYDVVISEKQNALIEHFLNQKEKINMNLPETIDVDFSYVKPEDEKTN
ncbi:hypothetical protein Leef1_47 [Polaribacter phage Leef_1]|uniref:Uncharacterized protein n=1 Tax=Polaribacter phage Leef_1 TaxID=2745684 RepID=A0A8E4ZK30_9CAUD|nr:hypothetical protein M1M28_gp47 [Polaribacter phage Leef_1]QQV91413.1 hypothetical protein Leef1_47 [Polaribacter phage Leef_1]